VGNWLQCFCNFEKKTYTISDNSEDDDYYAYDDGGGFEEDRNVGRVRSGDFPIFFFL
jgi:phage baseplate assembly protein gpV